MKKPPAGPGTLTRRRFVGLIAAGSAALVTPAGASAAAAAAAAAAKPSARPAAAAAAALSSADRKEFLRQQASTRSTLAVIRKHAMPPGTELASIFKPLKSRRGNG